MNIDRPTPPDRPPKRPGLPTPATRPTTNPAPQNSHSTPTGTPRHGAHLTRHDAPTSSPDARRDRSEKQPPPEHKKDPSHPTNNQPHHQGPSAADPHASQHHKIDKSDVRLVVHADVPSSIENYLQEAGRAGRDGKPADCVLLFNKGDLEKQFDLVSRGQLTKRDIAQILRAIRRARRRDVEEIVVSPGELLRTPTSPLMRRGPSPRSSDYGDLARPPIGANLPFLPGVMQIWRLCGRSWRKEVSGYAAPSLRVYPDLVVFGSSSAY